MDRSEKYHTLSRGPAPILYLDSQISRKLLRCVAQSARSSWSGCRTSLAISDSRRHSGSLFHFGPGSSCGSESMKLLACLEFETNQRLFLSFGEYARRPSLY